MAGTEEGREEGVDGLEGVNDCEDGVNGLEDGVLGVLVLQSEFSKVLQSDGLLLGSKEVLDLSIPGGGLIPRCERLLGVRSPFSLVSVAIGSSSSLSGLDWTLLHMGMVQNDFNNNKNKSKAIM